MTGSKSTVEHITYEQAYGRSFDDMMRRMPDLGRVQAAIGYQPRHTLDQTLQQIIDHERAALAQAP